VGFVKVLYEGGIIVGVLIFAPHAGEIIAEAAHAVRLKLKMKMSIIQSMPTHPTLPESFLEATRDVNNNAINLPSRK
jgi:pyruvate/2-oxoglutarate dehydrogenase complex dihydrolipoamide dehydrogenase (E3) component